MYRSLRAISSPDVDLKYTEKWSESAFWPRRSNGTTLTIISRYHGSHLDNIKPEWETGLRIAGRTSCMNFRQTGRTSLLRVAENIMTCFSTGVILKISCTSRLISEIVQVSFRFTIQILYVVNITQWSRLIGVQCAITSGYKCNTLYKREVFLHSPGLSLVHSRRRRLQDHILLRWSILDMQHIIVSKQKTVYKQKS